MAWAPLRILPALAGFLVAAAALAADTPGSADHPLVSRYRGSSISAYEVREFDRFVLPLGQLARASRGGGLADQAELEGRVIRISYALPPERSSLEVFRNYRAELSDGGFELLFECSGKACGSSYHWSNDVLVRGSRLAGRDDLQHFVATRLARPEGAVYVSLYASERSKRQKVLQLDVIETREMETDMVVVDAAAMADELERTGRIALYQVFFDFDRARLKEESEPALREIATLAADRPDLDFFVVGHTDAKGALDYNLDLSWRRAAAVVTALQRAHGVAPGRLDAHGVGPLSPVASNTDEAGRALNRRVELVLRSKSSPASQGP